MSKTESWWAVIKYEVWMFGETLKMAAALRATEGSPRRNVVTESLVLHARNLCDFCTPYTARWPDDIKPKDLFDDYDTATEYSTLRNLVEDVRATYQHALASPSIRTGTFDAGSSFGTFVEITIGTNDLRSPKWVFDKMLAHPTKDRNPSGFNYEPFLDLIEPKIKKLVNEIRRLENARGRDFPSLE